MFPVKKIAIPRSIFLVGQNFLKNGPPFEKCSEVLFEYTFTLFRQI